MEYEKVHIHTVKITHSGEKQLFQIRLPINAVKITGIQITIQPNQFVSDIDYTKVEDFVPKGIGTDQLGNTLIVY